MGSKSRGGELGSDSSGNSVIVSRFEPLREMRSSEDVVDTLVLSSVFFSDSLGDSVVMTAAADSEAIRGMLGLEVIAALTLSRAFFIDSVALAIGLLGAESRS